MNILFDGKKFASEIEEDLKKKVAKLSFTPKLVSILVGQDAASVLYTNLKKKAADKIGVNFEIINLSVSVTELEIIAIIKNLNKDENTRGIMVQLPLPTNLKLKQNHILDSIDPNKDVDGLTKNSLFMPATTKAVIRILGVAKENGLTANEKVVVIGSNGMVGSSVVKELKNLNYQVTGVDIDTKDLKAETIKADILISATGEPNLIKENMVKEDVVIIDVGSPVGDIDKNVYKKAGFVTPVPGGVGPVTIISLLENLVEAVS